MLACIAAVSAEGSGNAKIVTGPKAYPPNSKSNPLAPTSANVSYGKHERNKLDFWQAESETPTPVVMILHGGGWIAGSKANVPRSSRFPSLRAFLGEGISVVAIDYRLIGKHTKGVMPPVKATLHDAARAVQFVRSKAGEWNINKERIGAYGKSAGGCSSLWLAYHDDMADPKSEDPVTRESTRLWCAAGSRVQTTLDPRQLKKWFTNPGYGGHAFGDYAYGKDFEKFLADREKLLPWIKEYSPWGLVSAGDPPVYLSYGNEPSASGVGSDSIHGVTFGVGLQKRCTELGVVCHVVHPGAPDAKYKSLIEYLIATLKAPAAPNDFAQRAESRPIPHDSWFNPQSAFLKEMKRFLEIRLVKPALPESVVGKSHIVYSVLKDTPYGDRSLHLDVFHPMAKKAKGYPAVVLIHGGGWSSGSRSHLVPMAQQLAAVGYVAVPLEYRLTPEAKYPASLQDIRAAVRWLRRHAAECRIDPDKIAVLGCSSGALLATLIGVTNGKDLFSEKPTDREPSSDVQAVISIDGVVSLIHPEAKAEIGGKGARTWLGARYEENPALWKRASPLEYVGAESPPVLFVNSSIPRFHAGRDDFVKVLDRHGIYSKVHTFDNSPHPFWLFHPWFDPTVQQVSGFLDRVFKQAK
jgi:acetyl esterase/lipase